MKAVHFMRCTEGWEKHSTLLFRVTIYQAIMFYNFQNQNLRFCVYSPNKIGYVHRHTINLYSYIVLKYFQNPLSNFNLEFDLRQLHSICSISLMYRAIRTLHICTALYNCMCLEGPGQKQEQIEALNYKSVKYLYT
jgi:hypothetical protein